jgi:hypothetical protein
VEVEGDQVEVEVEFKWSMVDHEAAPAKPRQGSGARKSSRSPKAGKR